MLWLICLVAKYQLPHPVSLHLPRKGKRGRKGKSSNLPLSSLVGSAKGLGKGNGNFGLKDDVVGLIHIQQGVEMSNVYGSFQY